MIKGNLYDIRSAAGQEEEIFEDILSTGKVRIERIISSGDHLLLPAHLRHRVAYTSSGPGCVWLAVHGDLR